MDRIDIRPPVDWRTLTREEKLAWARAIVEGTRDDRESGSSSG